MDMFEGKLKFIKKEIAAKGTKTFFFAKPAGFAYQAGQYAYFTLDLKFPDARGNVRHFTLSSSPTDEFLTITCRMREESGYKKTLDILNTGDLVDFLGAKGDFILAENESNQQIFIAGGIGITPFRSIIKYVSDKNLTVPIHLIYSNSIPEEIAFKEEIDSITKSHQNITVDYTITKPEESQQVWAGHTGRIDAKLLQSLISNLQSPIYWLCGPPSFVEAMEETLHELDISQDQVRSEKFTGYV